MQTQTQIGTFSADGENNRTRLDGGGGQAIINFYHPINKQMLVVSANGTGWECQNFCPNEEGPYPNPLGLDPSATDLGSTTIDGKTVEHWQWFDKLFHIIKMDQQDWFIDQTGTTPVPVHQEEILTPFGGAPIGQSTQDFNSYKVGTPDASLFNVVNLKTCQKSQNCNDDSNDQPTSGSFFEVMLPRSMKSPLERAHRAFAQSKTAPSMGHPIKDEPSTPWPKDWSAYESNVMVVNQGGSPDGQGNICCSTQEVQCQVQYQSQNGQKFVDFSNQRTRFDDPVNGITVNDFKAHKSLNVVHNGTHDVCKDYCPIDKADTLSAGRSYFIDENATYMGKVAFNGKQADEWQWKETIFKVITMQTSQFYGDSSGDVIVPIAQTDHLTPFGGPEIGQSNATWTRFTIGTPPKEKFDIVGADTCPQNPQCGEQTKQMMRLAHRMFHTYKRYAL